MQNYRSVKVQLYDCGPISFGPKKMNEELMNKNSVIDPTMLTSNVYLYKKWLIIISNGTSEIESAEGIMKSQKKNSEKNLRIFIFKCDL